MSFVGGGRALSARWPPAIRGGAEGLASGSAFAPLGCAAELQHELSTRKTASRAGAAARPAKLEASALLLQVCRSSTCAGTPLGNALRSHVLATELVL